MSISVSISRYQKAKAKVKISNNKKYEEVIQQTLWLSMLENNKEWFYQYACNYLHYNLKFLNSTAKLVPRSLLA